MESDQIRFQRMLRRAVVLPVLLATVLALVLVTQVKYLLSVTEEVEHTDGVISQAQEVQNLLVDMETGIRGYLLTGREDFLEPYEHALPSYGPEFDALQDAVASDPEQVGRLDRVRSMQEQWADFARELHDRKTGGGDYLALVETGRGQRLMDAMRSELKAFDQVEQTTRSGQVDSARRITTVVVATSTLMAILIGVTLAFVSRRHLTLISRDYGRALDEARWQTDALRDSEERYRFLVEDVADYAICGLDRDGRVASWNVGGERILGYGEDEILGQAFDLFCSNIDTGEQVLHHGIAIASRYGRFEQTGWCQRKDGTQFWASVVITAMHDEGGIRGFSVLLRDVTERKRFEDALAQSAREYRGLFENAHDAILIFDPADEIVLDVNPSACDLYGLSKAQFVGMSLRTISQNPEYGLYRVQETLASDDMLLFETVQRRGDGTEIHLEVNACVVDYKGRQAIMSTNRDVSERKRVEEAKRQLNVELEHRVAERTAQLERVKWDLEQEIDEHKAAREALSSSADEVQTLNEALEQRVRDLDAANEQLESFSYSVSHDLRAPLRAIDGFSRILVEEYTPLLTGEALEYLQIVRENTVQMGRLIDDLLAFSRLSRQVLTTETVDVGDLVRRVLEDLRAGMNGRDVDVAVDGLPACRADRSLLKQVFVNLLSNAFKYTSGRETARIEVGGRAAGGGAGEVTYFVKDNGVGFDPRYAHKLFGVFQRLHRAEDYEGTGVGLAIVDRIVARHGGRVWAEAEVDRGATFYFTLPQGGTP